MEPRVASIALQVAPETTQTPSDEVKAKKSYFVGSGGFRQMQYSGSEERHVREFELQGNTSSVELVRVQLTWNNVFLSPQRAQACSTDGLNTSADPKSSSGIPCAFFAGNCWSTNKLRTDTKKRLTSWAFGGLAL